MLLLLLPRLLAKECFMPRQAWFLGNTIHLSSPGTSPANMLSLAKQSPGKKGRDDPSQHPSCHCKSHLKHTFIDDDLEAFANPKVSPWVPIPSPAQKHRKLKAAISGRLKWLSQKLAHSCRQRKEDGLASQRVLGSNLSSLTY